MRTCIRDPTLTVVTGHMTVSLLSHLLHPHPAATKIVLTEPLASVILISPWNKLFPSPSSMDTYKQTSDMIVPSAGQRWSSMYLGKLLLVSVVNLMVLPADA